MNQTNSETAPLQNRAGRPKPLILRSNLHKTMTIHVNWHENQRPQDVVVQSVGKACRVLLQVTAKCYRSEGSEAF
ncbi:MAG TPA: hypothetical protein VNV43_12565 [Candidatus Acidoferrales bacterium]|nr:hypothetical protein [Candidatus Acidoferrales bacterium]